MSDLKLTLPQTAKLLRQVLFDIRAGNSNLAKSLGEKSNHAMYQDQNRHRCFLSLQINKTNHFSPFLVTSVPKTDYFRL